MKQIENSEGPLGRVIRDKAMGDKLASTIDKLDSTVGKGGGRGLAPALLDDPATRDKALLA